MTEHRAVARRVAREALERGDAVGWFEALYGRAAGAGDESLIPWADLAPNPHLVCWLDARGRAVAPGKALVVGCGLGDDAEELARRGFDVVAFDVSSTAIGWCKRRFPDTRVQYHVADLFALPPHWQHAFDFVVEAYTLQVLPAQLHAEAGRRIAECVAPGGTLLVITRGRDPHDEPGPMPWPLTRDDLRPFAACGLKEMRFEDYLDHEQPPVRRFRVQYMSTGRARLLPSRTAQERLTLRNRNPMHPPSSNVTVLISADAEWRALRCLLPEADVHASRLGEWFRHDLSVRNRPAPLVFFHGGWGKISAAATTQYVIDHCRPKLLVNLGTCGGFDGRVEKGTIVLVDRVVVYDLINQMGSDEEAVAHYTTELDLEWLAQPYPHDVLRTHLVSGDRDLLVDDIPRLKDQYAAVAGDWESGSIAWVAKRNGVACLILRGVSDLVGAAGSEAYGNLALFEESARAILRRLLAQLPDWLAASPHL